MGDSGAERLGPGAYLYRGCEIRTDHCNEDYTGWWAIYDPGCPADVSSFWPTKKAAMAIIDEDPPEGY